jgi:hypothetical protein
MILYFWLDFRILLKHWTSWSWWSTLFTFCWAWASSPCATTSWRRTWMQRSNNLAERLITSATSVGLKLVFEMVEHFVRKVKHKCDQCRNKVGLWNGWTLWQKVNHKCNQCRTLKRSNNFSGRLITSAISVGLKLVFERSNNLSERSISSATSVGLLTGQTICPKGWTISPKGRTICPKGQPQVRSLSD